MTSFSAKLISGIPLALPAVIFLLMLPLPSNAQTDDKENRGRPLNPPVHQRPASVREREFKINEMERALAKPRTPEEEKLALAQIAEDFEKIQVVNNKMMGATMRAVAPDYARIADTTAEINTRASRIKGNLRLSKGAAKKDQKGSSYKNAHDAGGLKANLLSLDGSIISFIRSPIFKNPGVVDVEQAEKANRDLESIIELSNLINKDAKRLNKPSEKNR